MQAGSLRYDRLPRERHFRMLTFNKRGLTARILKNAAVVCLGAIVFAFMFEAFELSQVYHPTRESESGVTAVSPDGEDLFLTASDGVKLHAWFIPGRGIEHRRNTVFLFSHGNGGNLTSRPDYYSAILQTGAALLAYDYRGYGKSEGEPGEAGTYLDVFAAYDWLIERGFAPERIIAWGESLGGGIASKVAAERKLGGLVLQSSFTSMPDIGSEYFPFLPVHTLGKIKYDTHSRLPEIHCPVVVMHSENDDIIPYRHGRKNFERANEPKAFVKLEGGHNDSIVANVAKYVEGAETIVKLIEAQVDLKGNTVTK